MSSLAGTPVEAGGTVAVEGAPEVGGAFWTTPDPAALPIGAAGAAPADAAPADAAPADAAPAGAARAPPAGALPSWRC